MSSTTFGSANTGFQLGNNNGTIGTINISSVRPENSQQRTDNGSLPLCTLYQPRTTSLTIDAELLRSLAFPQMLDRRDNIEPCHTNTCQWILELDEYQSWRNRSCGILWIKGKPGAGKSTLMAFLHDRLKDLQDGSPGVIQLDFFFTARGVEMQRSPLGMLRSLLNQIFDRDATTRPKIREIYEQRCRQFGFGKRNWEWPQPVLEELLTSAILASANEQHVVIFVDALDEAGSRSAQQLAAYFHRLVDCAYIKKLALQVCISCRHYPIMESSQAIAIHVEDHNQSDIAKYIKDMLINTQVGDTQDLRDLLVERLTQNANGVFQWVHLIIPLIKQKVLEGESTSDIHDWLCDVPAGLEDVYTYILSNVIEARNRDQSFLFFQWLCLAEQPLTIVEIRYALAAKNAQIMPSRTKLERLHGFVECNERMKRRIKALAGGLAEVVSSEDNEETIQVVHQSVNDFLRVKGLALLCQSISAKMASIDMDTILFQCQATLYRSCLVYLTTMCSNKKMSINQGSRDDLIRNHPFLSYTTINLFIHAEKAGSDLLRNEKDTLQKIMSLWVETYQCLDEHSIACPPTGTTILHMAAAANLIDVLISLLSCGEDIERKNRIGETALHFAARAGHTMAGKVLQERGADQEAESNDGATPLIEAASYGHLEFVEWLLNEGVEIQTGHGGALQGASLAGHLAILEILLGAGADVNAQGGEYGNALQAAAFGGSVETVKLLLDAQADVNAQGGEYGNALQAAAFGGSVETVKLLLDAQADVNAQGGHYGNALQAAACDGSPDTVKLLLNAQADVNAQGGAYGNALQAAAFGGSVETVKLLLDAQVDVNAQGGRYGNALQAAAFGGSTEIVKLILEAQADVNAQGGEYGNALQAAVFGGSVETVKLLLDAQADVNAQGGHYGNALQAAVFGGSVETVKLLLDAQADVNAQGGHYGNALQAAAAAWKGDINVVKLLLDAQADVNAQGGVYGNALQAAAAVFGGNNEIIKLLLDSQADVNAQGGRYGNALQAAATRYDEIAETMKLLLHAQADVNAQGGHYGNALQAAACDGSPDTVKLLLNAQADVNAQGGAYGNALQAAVFGGSVETVKLLLDAQADVNAQGGHYGNALQAAAAAWKGDINIVKLLLDAQADVNAQGGVYGNALQAATYDGSPETVKLLLDAQADINAHGGRYGSPLLAAVHKGDAYAVQSLLQSGANTLLTDELDNTPLHITASKGMLHLLSRFPQLSLAMNRYNRLLQTPLHLAVYFGHFKFAIKLLHLGADPSLLDGHGRNVMDWAFGNKTLMQAIHEGCPTLVLTPHQSQVLTVQRSLLHLSDIVSQLNLKHPWPVLQQLARYLLFLNDSNNARHLFQARVPRNIPLANDVCKAICNLCNEPIIGTRFVCRICASADLCSFCVLKYPFHSTLHPKQKHDVFEVSDKPDNESQLTGPVSKRLDYFLSNLIHEPLEVNPYRSETQSSQESSYSLAQNQRALVPKTTLRLVIIFSVVFFGVLATFLELWYN